MSWVSEERDKYVCLASVTGEYDYRKNEIIYFRIIKEVVSNALKTLISKFLEEMDNEDLVEIILQKEEYISADERLYGGRARNPSFNVDISVLKEATTNSC